MAYVILGAGAVGGTVGFRLAQSGQRVIFIARGEHGRAMGERGLNLMSPVGSDRMDVNVLETVGEHRFESDDRLLLCTKSQDAMSALEGLDSRVPVFCFQNGVTTESSASRILERVYGVMSWIPSSHLKPGIVQVFSDSPAGSFRLGCYPGGEDNLSKEVARDLTTAGFDASSVPDASRWKYGKLLLNLGNAVDAFGLPDPEFQGLVKRAVEEGRSCLRAARLDFLPTEDLLAAMEKGPQPETIDGQSRQGGSTWQSATRGLPLETDHLNGCIVELGLRHGVPTPVNQAFVRMSKMACAPRSVPLAQVQAWAE